MNTKQRDRSVLNTLAYYQAMAKAALTPQEIKGYMLKKGDKMPLFEIQQALDSLEGENVITQKNGFWTVKTAQFSIQKRLEGAKNAALKWKRFAKSAGFIPYIPYVRGIAVTGSIALNNTTEKSDIDILIKTKENRIWTTRFLVTLSSWALGRRRYAQNIKNRLCFNHYITEDSTNFGPPNIHSVVERIIVPIWGEDEKDYKDLSIFYLKPKSAGMRIKRIVEFVFDKSSIGAILEKILGHIQIEKIKKNPVEYPKELKQPSLASKQLIFYYPKVRSTEYKYKKLLQEYT